MRLQKGKSRVLVISDMQEPFSHPDTLPFLDHVAIKYRTNRTVCIGDSLDNHCLGNWDQDPSGMGAKDEYDLAMKKLSKLYERFPVAIEVRSNHNDRLARKALKSGLPSVFIKDYREVMQYPKGWKYMEYCVIDGVMYEHGDSFGGMYAARNAAIHNGRSTAIGHFHSHGGVYYIATKERMIFGLNAGCLIDTEAYAFKYSKTMKFKPTLGCGVVLHGAAFFIPMMLKKNGRWDRKTQELI